MIQMMFDTSTSLDYDLSLPPTSSVATLAGRRATVVQTPTANPIVAAVPRGVVTTHCRSWGHATDAKKSALLGGLGNVLADLAQLALEGRCIAGRLGIDHRAFEPLAREPGRIAPWLMLPSRISA
jgi:hypothetical protein